MKKYIIGNILEDKIISEFETDSDFIGFTKRIANENEDSDIFIETLSYTIHYITFYCSNLILIIK